MSAGGIGAVLGVSADFHDAAAVLVVDGAVVAAAAEERFSRVKHDSSFPREAIRWCLASADLDPADLEAVAFYEKPFTKLERILSTHGRRGPRSLGRLRRSVGAYTRDRLWVGARTAEALSVKRPPRILYSEHHVSHAAAAFFASPFERAAILTCDGVGEMTTSSIGQGLGHTLQMREQLSYPASLGLFYAAMTEFCGFEVNDGESKLMGLAPYGSPIYADVLRDRVIDVGPHGAIRLDRRWFAFEDGRRMTRVALGDLLDGPRRSPTTPPGQREADIAASAQVILEEVLGRMAVHARDVTGERRLCMAGGVALNCVANSAIAASGVFDEVWVQPAPGDDGAAAGAALWAWHEVLGRPRQPTAGQDAMGGAALGPSFPPDEIATWLRHNDITFRRPADRSVLAQEIAVALADGNAVGWFQGAMEFGPRALGHRSILADPRDASMIQRLNQSVKRRESFRPFAPAVLADEAPAWFDIDEAHPYMVRTAILKEEHRRNVPTTNGGLAERLEANRSVVPACTHLDHSARIQTVDARHHPDLHALLVAFRGITGCPMLVNTSFNRRDEPIVCTPADAVRCFVDTDLDLLVLEDCIIDRSGVALHAPTGATP